MLNNSFKLFPSLALIGSLFSSALAYSAVVTSTEETVVVTPQPERRVEQLKATALALCYELSHSDWSASRRLSTYESIVKKFQKYDGSDDFFMSEFNTSKEYFRYATENYHTINRCSIAQLSHVESRWYEIIYEVRYCLGAKSFSFKKHKRSTKLEATPWPCPDYRVDFYYSEEAEQWVVTPDSILVPLIIEKTRN